MLAVATRAKEAGEQGLMPISEAMDKSQEAMEKARAKAIALATDLGIPKAEDKALADQMGFVPDTITTLVTAQGIPEATAEILSLRGKLESIKPGKAIQVTAPTVAAREQLEALGFTVQRIPGSKKVSVTAPTSRAREHRRPGRGHRQCAGQEKVTVQAIIKQAAGHLKNVQEKVAGLLKGKSIDVKAPTKTAQAALKDLGYKIKTVDGSSGKTVRITAPNKTPLAQVQAIQSKINGLTGKTINVRVQYTESGKPAVVRTHADGIMRSAGHRSCPRRRIVEELQAHEASRPAQASQPDHPDHAGQRPLAAGQNPLLPVPTLKARGYFHGYVRSRATLFEPVRNGF